MSGESRKKKTLLIYPGFQWHIIGYAAAMSGLILASIYGLLNFAFIEFMRVGNEAGLPPEHPYYQFIQMQQGTFNRIFLAISLVVAVLLFVGGLVISHRIAGPLLRMQNELKRVAEEKPFQLRPIQFRKKDYFPDLADAFNRAVEAWKKNS